MQEANQAVAQMGKAASDFLNYFVGVLPGKETSSSPTGDSEPNTEKPHPSTNVGVDVPPESPSLKRGRASGKFPYKNNPATVERALLELKDSNQLASAMAPLSSMKRVAFFRPGETHSIPMAGASLKALWLGGESELQRHIDALGPLVAVFQNDIYRNKKVAAPDFFIDLRTLYDSKNAWSPEQISEAFAQHRPRSFIAADYFREHRVILEAIFKGFADPRWPKDRPPSAGQGHTFGVKEMLERAPGSSTRAVNALYVPTGITNRQRESFILRQALLLSSAEGQYLTGDDAREISSRTGVANWFIENSIIQQLPHDPDKSPELLSGASEAKSLMKETKSRTKKSMQLVRKEEMAAIENLVGPNKPFTAASDVEKALSDGKSWLRKLRLARKTNAKILKGAKGLTFISSLQGKDGQPTQFHMSGLRQPHQPFTQFEGLQEFIRSTYGHTTWISQSLTDLYLKMAGMGPLMEIEEWSGAKHLIRVRDLFSILFTGWTATYDVRANDALVQASRDQNPSTLYRLRRRALNEAIRMGRSNLLHALNTNVVDEGRRLNH